MQSPAIVSDDAGGAIVTLQDGRSGNWDINAIRITGPGMSFHLEAFIRVAEIIPGDQGGSVSINWPASRIDVSSDDTITHWSVLRALRACPALNAAGSEPRLVEELDVTSEIPDIDVTQNGNPSFTCRDVPIEPGGTYRSSGRLAATLTGHEVVFPEHFCSTSYRKTNTCCVVSAFV